jgi:KAP family P-loop domain
MERASSGPAAAFAVALPIEPPFREPPADDAFGSGDIAKRLVQVLLRARPPYTISISGVWGIGKTTLIDQTLSELSKVKPSSLAVRIDLWSEDIADLRRAIAIEVGAVDQVGAEELKRNSQKAEEARTSVAKELDQELRTAITEPERPILNFELLKNLRHDRIRGGAAIGFVVVLAALIFIAAILPTPWGAFVAALIPGLFALLIVQSGLVLSVTTASKSIAPAEERVGMSRELRRRVSSPDGKALPVVIVIDNLDRLSGEDSFRTLGEIRAFLEISNGRCVFVIPIDRDAFASHLFNSLKLDDAAARDYLDKFFNLNVLLTKPAALDLREWSLRQVIKSMGERDDAAEAAEIIADAADGSPRAVQRILSGVVARSLLLDDEQRAATTLPQITLLEALVARFPAVIKQVGLTPRLLVEARDGLVTAVDDQERANALAPLLPGQSTPKDLGDFLMAHRSVSFTADQVRTILSLREDRDWRGVDDPDSLRVALRTGDPGAFATALEGRDEPGRVAAITRAIKLVREDSRHWVTGAVNGLNALVPSLPAGNKDAAALRTVGRDLLTRISVDQIRVLSLEAVRFLCAQPDDDRSLLAAADIAVSALRPAEGGDEHVEALVELLILVSSLLTGTRLDFVRHGLAERSEEDLAPLFRPGPHVPVLIQGPVFQREQDRVMGWRLDGEAAPEPIEQSLDRVLVAHAVGITIGQQSLDELAGYLTPGLSATPAVWAAAFEKLTTLMSDLAPSPEIDGLGQAFAIWAADRGEGFKLALRLPLQAPARDTIELAAGTWIRTGVWQEVSAFVAFGRGLIGTPGRTVNESLVQLWIDSRSKEVADLVADDGDAATQLLVRALDQPAVAEGTFGALVGELADVIVAHESAPAAIDLVAVVATHLQSIGLAFLTPLGAQLAKLIRFKPYFEPAIAAVEARIQLASDSAILASLAATGRAFSDAGIDRNNRLAKALVMRSKELQTIDWSTAEWLVRRPGISKPTFRDALVTMIRQPSVSVVDVVPQLASLRGTLRGDAQVTAAVIGRVSGMPCEPAEGLLGQMSEWQWPRPGTGSDEALLLIGSTCPGLLDRIGR